MPHVNGVNFILSHYRHFFECLCRVVPLVRLCKAIITDVRYQFIVQSTYPYCCCCCCHWTGTALAASYIAYIRRQYDARDTVIYAISSSIVVRSVMRSQRQSNVRKPAAGHACAGSTVILTGACSFVDKPNILFVASTNWLDRTQYTAERRTRRR